MPTRQVTLNPDGSVTVIDNGRGISTDIHTGAVSAEVIMTAACRRQMTEFLQVGWLTASASRQRSVGLALKIRRNGLPR
jgi:DNA gyrase subunit B